jgi:ATP-dependent helicase YprA (DUF1998 family)
MMNPPTPDDLAAGFVIAARDLAPAMQRAEEQYGLAALIAAFALLGDVLTAFGVTEAELTELARQSARMQLMSPSRPPLTLATVTVRGPHCDQRRGVRGDSQNASARVCRL